MVNINLYIEKTYIRNLKFSSNIYISYNAGFYVSQKLSSFSCQFLVIADMSLSVSLSHVCLDAFL